MALLFMDGFDHYGSGASPITLGKWGTKTALIDAFTGTPARTGTLALRFPDTNYDAVTKALPASGGVVVGVAVYAPVAMGAFDILEVREGTTVHLGVATSAAGLLSVKRGGTVLATGTTALGLTSWYYLELKATIHDTTGSYEVRIDGVTEAALTASGVDTRNAGATGQWDRIRLACGCGNWMADDVYVCDQSGAIRNTFLGPCKVETLLPQTDAVAAGSNAGLTPSTGTDHGALVDEATPNTTDYTSAATVGLKDTYQYPALALTGSILGVQTNLYVQKSDAAVRQVCAVVRSGGVDYDGANVAPLTTFSYFSEVRAQNPNTSTDWTSATVNALEAGMKVTV